MSSHYESERRRCRTPERRKETNNSSTDRDRYRGHRRSSSPSHSKIPPRSKEKERVRDRSRSMESRRTAKGESSRKHVPRRTDRSPTPDRKVSESKKREERSRSRKRSKSKVKKKSKEHKKRHKKKRSSSSSDSSSSESSSGSSTSDSNQSHSELKLLHKLEANRLKMIEEKQKQKELIKANETPEEKRARRLAKKRLKERGRRARAGWHSSHQGYTDHDNPFGDAALTDAFVWGKKLAKLGPSTATPEELERINRQTQIENKIELEKVAARRAARAAAGEAEADGARAREDAHYSAWAALEHAFHLQQARLRSHIRVRDQRAKPIDLLAWYISSAEAADALHMHEPYTFLQGLSATDLDDLLEDIKVYMELEGGENAEYWRDVLFVVQDERRACRLAARPAVHASVADHCTQVLRNKSGAALEALALEISARVANPRPGLDVSYWESLLTQLQAHMARARLRDLHQRNLRTKLDALRHEQGLEGGDVKAEGGSGGDDQAEGGGGTPEGGEGAAGGSAPPHDTSEPEEESAEDALEAWRRSGYSPPRVSLVPGAGASTDAAPGASTHTAPGASTDAAPDTGPDTEWARVAALVVSEREDEQRLAALRAARCRRATNNTQASGAGGAEVEAEAEAVLQRAMVAAEGAAGGGGARFGGELVLGAAPPPAWTDKYRPRKPRYFNRVHTGFEWNKYNQTHYDMDNPPPKIVQGYKFNIFYPELIDKGATPAFSLKPCPENSEFAILRFSAGPPYEDIAFKIVNREWEYSYKRGFRCHFHNNIFQLWFHFKRYRYRR